MRPTIAILGPTASGKSSLGVRLARRFGGIILSADSRQVYRGLNAGTAKITRSQMRGIPHYLIDIASPQRQLTVAQFQRVAQRVIRHLPPSNPIFVVGGSPFYLEAILSPIPFPAVPPNPPLRRRLERKTTPQLFAFVARRDPKRAAAVDPYNRRRLIRAIEIIERVGFVPRRPSTVSPRVLKLGLDLPRTALYRRIDRRLDQRLPAIIREVRRLHRHGLAWARMESLGLEYRWISRIVRGQAAKDDAVQRLRGDIHAFARRQISWWRRDRSIHWIANATRAERLVAEFLRHNKHPRS